MKRVVILGGVALLLAGGRGAAQTKDDKAPPEELPPAQKVEEVGGGDLKLMDAAKDGKTSRAEAKGRFADGFDRADLNKDGYLDREELRKVAQFVLAMQKDGGGKAAPPADFDALDKNADGRLSPDELKGTPWAARFA